MAKAYAIDEILGRRAKIIYLDIATGKVLTKEGVLTYVDDNLIGVWSKEHRCTNLVPLRHLIRLEIPEDEEQ